MMLANQQIWKILVGQELKAKANPEWLTMASSCLLHAPSAPVPQAVCVVRCQFS